MNASVAQAGLAPQEKTGDSLTNMKTSAQKQTPNKPPTKPRLRRKLLTESELPPEAQEFRRKFREWHESFQPRAKRMAFIRKLCKRIAEAYQPEKIILFGSHAYGTPTPESDIDLMIVMDYEGRPIEQTLKIRRELDIVTPVDVLVRSPAEIAFRLEDGDMFIVDIMRRGKVMYESQHKGVDEKAEDDWEMAQRAYRARKRPSYDAACFHAQQCLEKYLKARLNEAGNSIKKTHDLAALLDDVLPAEPNWLPLRVMLDPLTKYAVLYRYPGYNATKIETKGVLTDCRAIRRIIRTAFGLPV